MINIKDNCWIPSEGYKYITDGEGISTMIFLGHKDSIERWHDANEEPPIPTPLEEATAEDYQNALERFGVIDE